MNVKEQSYIHTDWALTRECVYENKDDKYIEKSTRKVNNVETVDMGWCIF